jgi:cellobiose-specific phosphotransferase system component IIC
MLVDYLEKTNYKNNIESFSINDCIGIILLFIIGIFMFKIIKYFCSINSITIDTRNKSTTQIKNSFFSDVIPKLNERKYKNSTIHFI